MARAKQNQEEFIALFRDLPCLWQTTSKEYHDRPKREAAYHTLLEKMKEVEPLANKDCVIKKINNMRSSFRKEVKKIKESMKTGSGAYEVYKPKLWYFESLRFLNDQKTPRQSISNIDNHDSENEFLRHYSHDQNIQEGHTDLAHIAVRNNVNNNTP
ncbi:hypothetical protein J6590_075227 [Homalodisca vitripennis]|nr:hypothetical protein J6590_075227 [Homalodisca vitripennis]